MARLDRQMEVKNRLAGLLEYKGGNADGSKQSGVMVALIPSVKDANRLAIPDGEPVNDLHATLLILGDASKFDSASRLRIMTAVRNASIGMAAIKGNAFSASVFNPMGEAPCLVLGVGGRDLAVARDVIEDALREVLIMPSADQHEPWTPHVTLIYTDEPDYYLDDAMERTGQPVLFDAIRVAFAGDYEDIPLGQPEAVDLRTRLDNFVNMSFKSQTSGEPRNPKPNPKPNNTGFHDMEEPTKNPDEEDQTNNSGVKPPTRRVASLYHRANANANSAVKPDKGKSLWNSYMERKAVVRVMSPYWEARGYQVGDTIRRHDQRHGSRRGRSKPVPKPDVRPDGKPTSTAAAPTRVVRGKKGSLAAFTAVGRRPRKTSLSNPNVDPNIREAVSGAFEGQHGRYRAKVRWSASHIQPGLEPKDGMALHVEGVVHDDSGNEVGSFVRHVYPVTGVVENSNLDLDPQHQGQRFADSFYQQADAELYRHGIRRSTLTANGEVGGYAWARRGYDWDLDYRRATFTSLGDRIESVLQNGNPNYSKENDGSWSPEGYVGEEEFKKIQLAADERKQLQAWLAIFREAAKPGGSMRGLPTPQDIAEYGEEMHYPRFSSSGREYRSWIGKDILMGSVWRGIRDIEPPDDAAETKRLSGQAYMDVVRKTYTSEEKDWKDSDYIRRSKGKMGDMNSLAQNSADIFLPPMAGQTQTKAAVITPGGRIGDNSHLNLSPKNNWVDKRGGLPEYIRIVRNGLMKEGHPEGMATALAVASMKKWAHGGGGVSKKVQVAAAAALAQWEAMKATKGDVDDIESKKSGVLKRVRDAAFWHMPVGTPIKPGQKPPGDEHPSLPSGHPSHRPHHDDATGTIQRHDAPVHTPEPPHPPRQYEHGHPYHGRQVARDVPLAHQGLVAQTDLVHFENGDKKVRKRAHPLPASLEHKVGTPEEQADRETLGALVYRALGLDAPHTEKTAPHEVHMDYKEGFKNGTEYNEDAATSSGRESIFDSEHGKRMGIMDLASNNVDRNYGNWMYDDTGHLVPIDHGKAFWQRNRGPDGGILPPQHVTGAFARNLGLTKLGSPTQWQDSDKVSQADVRDIIRRVAPLRDQFAAYGRTQWHDDMMEALEEIYKHAKGKTRTLGLGE